MSWQRSFWFSVPLVLTKQIKPDNDAHGEVTVNIAAIVLVNHLVLTLPGESDSSPAITYKP